MSLKISYFICMSFLLKFYRPTVSQKTRTLDFVRNFAKMLTYFQILYWILLVTDSLINLQ